MNYKDTLETIVKNNSVELQSIELDQLIEFMLSNIGNVDSYLRDNLIYRGFCQLILEEKVSVKQTEFILKTCMDDHHLYLNIQQANKTNDVFARSFSTLVIVLILYKDAQNRQLPETLVVEAIDRSMHYLMLETDYRGYVEGKGWAHSVAHGSDLVAQAIKHPLMNNLSASEITFQGLKSCLHTDYAYIDEEDERMMPVIDALLEKGLADESLLNWLKDLHNIGEQDYLKKCRYEWNVKKFTQTLLMHLLKLKKCEQTTQWIFSKYTGI